MAESEDKVAETASETVTAETPSSKPGKKPKRVQAAIEAAKKTKEAKVARMNELEQLRSYKAENERKEAESAKKDKEPPEEKTGYANYILPAIIAGGVAFLLLYWKASQNKSVPGYEAVHHERIEDVAKHISDEKVAEEAPAAPTPAYNIRSRHRAAIV